MHTYMCVSIRKMLWIFWVSVGHHGGLRTGTRNIDVLWGKACDHWSTKLPTLCAAAALAQILFWDGFRCLNGDGPFFVSTAGGRMPCLQATIHSGF